MYKSIKNKWVRRSVFALTITLFIWVLLVIAVRVDFYVSFVRRTQIEMARLEAEPLTLTIPVRYKDTQRLTTLPVVFFTPQNDHYAIHVGNSPADITISCCRQAWGGFVIFTPRYEITDPAIRAELWQLATDKQKHLDGE